MYAATLLLELGASDNKCNEFPKEDIAITNIVSMQD
jgi:hypothetical protein